MSKTKQHWLIIAHCFNMDGRAASRVVTDRVSLFLEHNIEPIIVMVYWYVRTFSTT